MQSLLPYAIGAVAVVGLYLLYTGVTKGLPAVKAKLSSWWNAAKKEVGTVKADVAALETRVTSLEEHLGLKAAPVVAAAAAAAPAAAVATAAPAAAPAIPAVAPAAAAPAAS